MAMVCHPLTHFALEVAISDIGLASLALLMLVVAWKILAYHSELRERHK
jgi:uncharacterized membrane protein